MHIFNRSFARLIMPDQAIQPIAALFIIIGLTIVRVHIKGRITARTDQHLNLVLSFFQISTGVL